MGWPAPFTLLQGRFEFCRGRAQIARMRRDTHAETLDVRPGSNGEHFNPVQIGNRSTDDNMIAAVDESYLDTGARRHIIDRLLREAPYPRHSERCACPGCGAIHRP